MKSCFLRSPLVALCLTFAPAAMAADAFPTRPITIIVPYAASSVADTVPRAVAEEMRATLGQSIVVENRPGAGGAIGMVAAANALPDGHTLVATGSPAVLAMETMLKPGFDLDTDFVPVGPMVTLSNVIAVSAKHTFRTVQDLVAYAKANPGKLNYATSGPSTPSDLGGQLFGKVHGIEMTLVPYKGATPAMVAIVAGEADLSIIQAGLALPHIQSGKVRALAVTGPDRWSALPEIPNMTESGANVLVNGLLGLSAPKGTPPEAIALLNKALVAALKSDSVARLAFQNGGAVVPGTPGDLTRLVAEDRKAAKAMVAAAGLQKQ